MPTVALLDLPGLRTRESAEPGFATALQAVADSLRLDANYLAAVMSFESQVDPAARNPTSGATGLIQFMPSTAALLGTTTDELRKMSAIEQLEFVLQYYTRAGRAIRRDAPGDYYMAVFMPAHVGKPASFVLATQGQPAYDQNRGLDANKDGVLTVGDVTTKFEGLVAGARTRPPAVFEEKKKAAAPRAVAVQPAPSPLQPSPASSSGQHFGSAGSAEMELRATVLFAALGELAIVEGLIRAKNYAGVQARINAYWASALRQPASSPHPKEWCGAFCLWALHAAGLGPELRWRFEAPNDKRSGFLYSLRITANPLPGDIAYLDQPWQHHALVERVEGDLVHTVDGNQGTETPIRSRSVPRRNWSAFYSIASLLERRSIA